MNHVWQDFLDIVRHEAGSRVVETWLKAVILERWDAPRKTVFLRAPNSFVQDWICSHYLVLIKEHLSRLFSVDGITIIFVEQAGVSVESVPTIVPARLILDEPESEVQEHALVKRKCTINDKYQFDNFVVGPSNSLSYAAAQAVVKRPGFVYNPLFFYGGSGLGKTHLLHAIGNDIKKNYRKMSVLYQTADRFVNEFIHAIRFDKVDVFKEKYKAIDVLLIDDIQFIAHKEQTQEAFFHIFNALYESSKQIVFSSDVYPKAMHGIAERLRSRLEWGLITDIQEPTLEEKIVILKRKAERIHGPIPDEIACLIAQQATSNVRDLEGMLIRVFAFASLTGQPLSVDVVNKVVQRPASVTHMPTLDEVAQSVARSYQYSLAQLRSKERNKELVLARHIAMYMMKKVTDKSLQDIGLFWRRKDHSTVAHAITKITRLIEKKDRVRVVVDSIEQSLLH